MKNNILLFSLLMFMQVFVLNKILFFDYVLLAPYVFLKGYRYGTQGSASMHLETQVCGYLNSQHVAHNLATIGNMIRQLAAFSNMRRNRLRKTARQQRKDVVAKHEQNSHHLQKYRLATRTGTTSQNDWTSTSNAADQCGK